MSVLKNAWEDVSDWVADGFRALAANPFTALVILFLCGALLFSLGTCAG